MGVQCKGELLGHGGQVKARGKVRTELVKRIARELVERFPDKFTTDFETNKKLLESLTNISSKNLRNRVAGYIVRLQNQKEQKKLTTEQIEINS
jgi:small subunit ribosomal protein S17e